MWDSCLLDKEHTDGQTIHLEHWTVQDEDVRQRVGETARGGWLLVMSTVRINTIAEA